MIRDDRRAAFAHLFHGVLPHGVPICSKLLVCDCPRKETFEPERGESQMLERRNGEIPVNNCHIFATCEPSHALTYMTAALQKSIAVSVVACPAWLVSSAMSKHFAATFASMGRDASDA